MMHGLIVKVASVIRSTLLSDRGSEYRVQHDGLSKLLSETLRDESQLGAYVMMACWMYERGEKCDSDHKKCIR